MKKYFNKLLALVIATVIILTFSAVPAFASGSPPTTWTLTTEDARPTLQTITAANISGAYGSSITVMAYQIVRGTYKDGKLTGYVLCDSINAPIANIEAPTSTEIANIANYIEGHPTAFDSVQMHVDTTSVSYTQPYIAEVEAGEYIILVRNTGSLSGVYNPAIVAVNVSDANNIDTSSSGGTVNMYSQFSFGPTAYMKYSSHGSFFYKQIVMNDNTKSWQNSASFGDTVNFNLNLMKIPSYSEDYGPAEDFTLKYKITDDLYLDHSADTPFLGVNGLKVRVASRDWMVAEDEVAEGANTYTVTYYDEDGAVTNDATEAVKYEIEFTDAFIRANGTKYVEVAYSSILTDNAKLAISNTNEFVSNDTRAILQYSNDPTDETSSCTINGEQNYTHTYTYGIDSGNGGIQTYELNKVTQAGGTYTSVPDSNNETTKKSPYALAGATFTIYSDAAMTEVIASAGTATTPPNGTSISDANGHIEFRGLGPGTYYIKETAVPSGYTLNENNYKIVISSNNVSGNLLNSYSITTYLIGSTDTQIGSAIYEKSYIGNGNFQVTPAVTPAEVVNTTLANLPTTGGMGTIVISIVAGLGMAVFLTIFVISKKRSSKKLK